jgi:hypothetical protein
VDNPDMHPTGTDEERGPAFTPEPGFESGARPEGQAPWRRMPRRVAAAALAAALLPLRGHAGCEDAAKALFGLSLGPAAGYLEALRPGLRRDGSSRLVPEVGLESLAGSVDGVDWDRVVAFVDHGRFYSLLAVGAVAGASDQGFEAITRRLAQASGATPAVAGTRAAFACAAPYELVVETRPGQAGPRVSVSLADAERRVAAQRYVQAWCADPAHKDQPSACRK